MRNQAAALVLCLFIFCPAIEGAELDKERLTIVRAKLAKGEILVSRGEYAAAERLFRTAVAAEPLVPTSHMGLGAALVGLERFEEALLVLEEAERRFIDWEQMIGIAELQKRQYADRQMVLIADLTAATNPNTSQVSNIGTPRDLKQINEDRVSKEQFLFRERRDLEGLHSIPAQVFYLEGIAHLRTDRPILGIEALEVCLLVDKDHGLAHYNLAVALFGQGEYDEAQEHLDAAVLAGVEPHASFVSDLAAASDR